MRARPLLAAAVALWLAAASAAAEDATHPLTLADVLRSTDDHFPRLHAARAEQSARAEELRSARGAFDLELGASADARPAGFYESYTGQVGLEQQTRLWGARLFAGYRYGTGDFPSYEGGRLTDDDGELRVGVRLPLLRGGRVDPARAELETASIALDRMTPELELEQLAARRSASIAFWDWVAAGHRLRVAARLLEVAEQRASQIEGRVARGADPRIDLVDNQRLIAERRGLLRGAERDFEQAALRLSIFWRDAHGAPIAPAPTRLPDAFPEATPLDADALASDLDFARVHHPLLRRFAFERERLEVDRNLARNDMLPALDLRVEGSRDFGDSNPGIDEVGKLSAAPRSDTEVRALVEVRLPVQRREARGRLGAADARIRRLASREQLARDEVVTDALQTVEAIDAALVQTEQARENLRLAEALRVAEQRKLALGASNLIDVNIREVQEANAARQLVDAQYAYFRAHADYVARIGRRS